MTAKENALRIIRFDRPEYVMTGLPIHYIAWRGCNHEGYAGGGHECPVGTRWTDVWGTEWEKVQAGVMGFPVSHPIPDADAFRRYRWPDPDDERICGRIYEGAKKFPADRRDDLFLSGSHRETLWEKSYMLVGMENVMTLILTEPLFVKELLHRIMDFDLAIARHYVKAGIEAASLGDDLGTQLGPLLGPRIVNEFLVPEYRRLFDFYRERRVLITFHSCGNIESVVETFMDLGVNVLNPVQATANDLDKVRRETMGKMALQGAVSSGLIMEGPPERIALEARRRMWQLGREGGYFCAPDQGMPWPQSHIDALNAAVKEFGRYPLENPDA
jgi:uroporphyrinogen decarboxylase